MNAAAAAVATPFPKADVAVGSAHAVPLRAMSPRTALSRFSASLTAFEKDEITSYEEIYYVGESARKVGASTPRGAASTPRAAACNSGYDDDKGDYRVVMDDHIAYRYQVIHELGRGSFGQVSKALDHKTKSFVALKIIKNKKKFHDQALIEVELLKHIRERDPHEKSHVVRMLDHFVFRSHMVITFELHGMNLYELCKSNRFNPMTIPTIKNFAKQILVSLSFLHSQRIVHCDLKPENILLKKDSKSQIRLIDLGSSCFENQRLYTYIQSRFYRAPEVMLGLAYTSSIDMWSFGCILAEMANGYPIFPGESENEQFCLLMSFLGVPPRSLLDRAARRKVFFDANNAPKLPANSRGKVHRPSSRDLSQFLKAALVDGEGSLFVDFVTRCLCWDPDHRWTPSQAMSHPWLSPTFDNATARSAHDASTPGQTRSSSGIPSAPDPSRLVLPQLPAKPSGRKPMW
jgi:dual specificity tyrosine-phosphorylation-regulated kinase 2/3/4